MNRWLRLAPPKVKLATTSGMWSFPSSVPSVRGRRPDAAAGVQADAIEVACVAGREDLATGERGVIGHPEDPHVLTPAVDDVQRALVGRERQPVGPLEVVGHDPQLPAGRVKPEHVTG